MGARTPYGDNISVVLMIVILFRPIRALKKFASVHSFLLHVFGNDDKTDFYLTMDY